MASSASLLCLHKIAIVFLILIVFTGSGYAQVDGDPIPLQTCFDFTGRPLTNNTQCPGSNACCNYLHQCTDNLLCTQDDSEDFVNALCAENPWSNCSNICQYGQNLYGYLPRVTECKDGSYCCDSDPTCCAYGRGTFLDGWGNILSQGDDASSTPTPGTRIMTATGLPSISTGLTATGETTPVPDPDPTDGLLSSTLTSTSTPPDSTPAASEAHQTLPVAAKAGIGVAVSFSVLSFVALSMLLVLRRRRNKLLEHQKQQKNSLPSSFGPPGSVSYPAQERQRYYYELHDHSTPVEMPARPLEKAYL